MKIKESLDQTKFPTRHLKDIGIQYIRKLKECLEDEEEFIKLIQELCDKTIWLSVTTKDLYYWIEVLNKVDTLLAKCISTTKDLIDGNERTSEEEFRQKLAAQTEKVETMLTFTANLLKEGSSRTIYNSVDRLVEIMKLFDSLDLIYLCLDTVYILVKKSYITGKFTKAHESQEYGLLKHVYILSLGFNCLTDEKLSIVETLDYSVMMEDLQLKLRRLQRVRKGHKEMPCLSYFKMPADEIVKVKVEGTQQATSRNIAFKIIKDCQLNPGDLDVISMKILYIQKLMAAGEGESNLIKINKIILKAKSLFIHLSSAEEVETNITLMFIRDHPFNTFIPDLLNYCTAEAPRELH